jgi:protein involved in polysaccharide export with SLBB domain
MYKQLLSALFCLLLALPLAAQQPVNNAAKRAQKGQITDEEMQQYQQQIQDKKLTPDEVSTMMKERGASKEEIDQAKQSMSNQGSGSSTQTGADPRGRPVDQYKTLPNDSPSSQIFGSNMFTSSSLSFEPNLRIATPANYVLGPDDELLINISGYQEANIKAQVQPEGTITIPQVGVINVAGLTIEGATRAIRTRMTQTAYPNLKSGLTRLNITLGKIRSIRVTIIGGVKPGNYTVSSLTTVFNSLFLCGGPDTINSYRAIELIRGNKIIKKIDLYLFLTKGDLSGNVLLQEGDVINIPVYKKRVALTGEVKRTGIFELIDGENLNQLLFYAGGFTKNAYTASIKIKQISETERSIKDIAKSNYLTYTPGNGDEIIVLRIPERIVNSVSVSGAVYLPGFFEFSEGLTVSELLKKAGGLKEDAFMDRGMVTRVRNDKTKENISFKVTDITSGKSDIVLQKQDNVNIASATTFISDYSVLVEGEVRSPGSYPYKDNLSLKDILLLAGSFTDAGTSYHIEVSRRLTAQANTPLTDSLAKVFFIDTDKSLSFEGNSFTLKPFDIVSVRRNPMYSVQQRVTIGGEVLYPGQFTITSKHERLSDLFKKAGGLTPSAYIDGVSLVRKAKDDDIANDTTLKKVIASMQHTLKDTTHSVIRDNRATSVKIAVNMSQVLKSPGSKEDYVLEEGDVVTVAKLDPLVKVSGEVLYSSKINYETGRSVRYYLSRAGGTTDIARLSKVYVIYANGQLDKTDSHLFGLIRSYPKIGPGSEIVVPGKMPRRGLTTGETVGITSALVSIVSLIVITLNAISK